MYTATALRKEVHETMKRELEKDPQAARAAWAKGMTDFKVCCVLEAASPL